MNQFFLDSLPSPVFVVEEGKLKEFNAPAVGLFPALKTGTEEGKETVHQWLQENLKSNTGDFLLFNEEYTYKKTKNPSVNQEIYSLERKKQEDLHPQQMEKFLQKLRDEMAIITTELEEVPEEPYAIIYRSLSSMERMVENAEMLQSKQLLWERKSIDLSLVLQKLQQEIQIRNLQSAISLKGQMPTEAIWVLGDETLFRKICLGLVANAGAVPQNIEFLLKKEGEMAILTVKDERKIKVTRSLSELLTGTDSERNPLRYQKGAGLGLPLIWKIVQEMGGTPFLEQDMAGGLVFTFAFPLDMQKNSSMKQVNSTTKEEELILVTSNNREIQKELSQILGVEEYNKNM